MVHDVATSRPPICCHSIFGKHGVSHAQADGWDRDMAMHQASLTRGEQSANIACRFPCVQHGPVVRCRTLYLQSTRLHQLPANELWQVFGCLHLLDESRDLLPPLCDWNAARASWHALLQRLKHLYPCMQLVLSEAIARRAITIFDTLVAFAVGCCRCSPSAGAGAG